MPTPTVTDRTTTRPAVGLTGKGRAYLALAAVRDRWDSLSDDQQAECADLVARLSVAMRNEKATSPGHAGVTTRVPLVGRLSA